jgi:hypothetical protein
MELEPENVEVGDGLVEPDEARKLSAQPAD